MNPIVVHIARMLEELPEDPVRAVYMVTRQLHEAHNKNITK